MRADVAPVSHAGFHQGMRTSLAVHVDGFHCREFGACTTIGSAGNCRSGKLQLEHVDLGNALGNPCVKPHVCRLARCQLKTASGE